MVPRSVLLALVCAAAACSAGGAEGARRVALTPVDRPRPAAPAPSVELVSSPSAGVGTPHPALVLATASDATWVALCQARSDTDHDGRVALRAGPLGELTGDRAQAYFVSGSGAGTPIDELLASAPGGRFAAVRRGTRALLVDALAGTETELGAGTVDLEADGLPFRQHRSVAFDRAGARVLYVRQGPAQGEIVVRDLASGAERALPVGPGAIARAEFAGDAAWLVAHVVAEDTDGNGRLEWAWPRRAAEGTACATAHARFPVWQARGDGTRVRLARADDTRFHDATGFVTVLGEGFVARQASERLVWTPVPRGTDTGGAGTAWAETELAPAACAARVVYVDAVREALVVGCSAAGPRWPLRLVARGYSAELGTDLAPTELVRPCEAAPRLLALYPGQDSMLLDLERRVLVPLQSGDLVLCTHGKTALIQRRRELWTFDVDSGIRTFLTGGVAAQPDVLLSSPAVYVTPWVVDVSRSKLLGRLEGTRPPLALARSGQLLVWPEGRETARSGSGGDLRLGPLRWSAPRP